MAKYVPHPLSAERRREIQARINTPEFHALRAKKRWPNGATFWARIPMTDGANACWNWTVPNGTAGYGQASYKGRTHGAHVVSWLRLKGPIPEGMEVCHSCHNRACVNPAHLYLAPHYQNQLDSKRAGRMVIPNAGKLNAEKVVEICRLAMAGMRVCDIHRRFGVHRSIVEMILKGKKWRDVPRPEGFAWPMEANR